MKKRSIALTTSLVALALGSCGQVQQSSENQNGLLLSEAQQQFDFEETYIKDSFSYESGGKFALSIISNIATIVAGSTFESPTTVVGGVIGLITCISDNLFSSSGPTIKDVMNKLGEMDTKLDAINEKLDKNYNQLMSETIRTQAMVDRVLLEEMETAISNYNTDYIVPVEDYFRDFSDYIEHSYKDYIKQAETSEFYVYKNEKNEWCLNSLMSATPSDAFKVTVAINDFSNATTFLDKNDGYIVEGFTDRLNEDFDNAVASASLPQGLEKPTARDFIAANLVENFTKSYYEANHQKALDLRNMSINLSKQISGKAVKSIVDRYISRMQCMFCFAGEMKNYVTDALSNIMYTLRTTNAMAAQACAFADVSQEELRTEFVAAEKAVQDYYANFSKIKDNYCFLTNTCLKSGFYRAMFWAYFTNHGNDCVFHANFKLDKVLNNPGDYYLEDDVNAHSYLSEVDHTRIATRWNLMRELGINASHSYIDYLLEAKIVNSDDYAAYTSLRKEGYVSEDALRFFTGLTIRDLNDSDKDFTLQCIAAGNLKGDYFTCQWQGTFRSAHSSDCWSGKKAETTFIDANTGTIQTNKKVAAYATYSESHAYWINDEHWAFVDNLAGNYFFTLENVA